MWVPCYVSANRCALACILDSCCGAHKYLCACLQTSIKDLEACICAFDMLLISACIKFKTVPGGDGIGV
jgi:hypothetical protein